MSRQYPATSDIEYFIVWAEQKIIQMAHTDRAMHFLKTAELTRSIAYYLSSQASSGLSGQWLCNRISDTYYSISSMQNNEGNIEGFRKSEGELLDTLRYIVEYYEENGITDPNLGAIMIEEQKEWKIPVRWLQNFSIEIDNIV